MSKRGRGSEMNENRLGVYRDVMALVIWRNCMPRQFKFSTGAGCAADSAKAVPVILHGDQSTLPNQGISGRRWRREVVRSVIFAWDCVASR